MRLFLGLLSFFLLLSCATMHRSSADETLWQVCFTPDENCADQIVILIETAKHSIFLQAYSFTSSQIANALLRASKRGVHIEIILDKSARSAKYSSGDLLANKGIPVYIDSAHSMADDKVILIDEETIMTGSINFSKISLENNGGNLLILHHKFIARKYLENWKQHRRHSESYTGQ
ncbi:MAG: phospholipase D family protein [Nitrospirae bacterium]|nr:phospholipase D family protein [Nitrospirota bacterium]MBI3593902.1 phospholipase D family protein [Nitrospirota bacterium]